MSVRNTEGERKPAGWLPAGIVAGRFWEYAEGEKTAWKAAVVKG
mgnify:CR=1 FL=1